MFLSRSKYWLLIGWKILTFQFLRMFRKSRRKVQSEILLNWWSEPVCTSKTKMLCCCCCSPFWINLKKRRKYHSVILLKQLRLLIIQFLSLYLNIFKYILFRKRCFDCLKLFTTVIVMFKEEQVYIDLRRKDCTLY